MTRCAPCRAHCSRRPIHPHACDATRGPCECPGSDPFAPQPPPAKLYLPGVSTVPVDEHGNLKAGWYDVARRCVPCDGLGRFVDDGAACDGCDGTGWAGETQQRVAAALGALPPERATPAASTPKMSYTERSKLKEEIPMKRSSGVTAKRWLMSTMVLSAAR